MRKEACAILCVTTWLAAACSLAPEYTRPDAGIPEQLPTYNEAPTPAQASESMLSTANLPWRAFFADENLQKVIELALSNNKDFKSAALAVERARAMYRIERAELAPTVTGVTDGSRAQSSLDFVDASRDRVTERYAASAAITSWELDLFGRIKSLGDSAVEEYFATEYGRRAAQISLISEVANAYLTLAADRENLALANLTLESQRAAYQVIKRRFEVGMAPELTLRQVQTRVDAARVDVARFTQRVAQDQNALNFLAGTTISEENLPQTLGDIATLQDVSPGTSSDVLLSRPDILAAESQLKAANANIGAARATLFPRIALTSSIGTASVELSDLFKGGMDTWSFAPVVTMPIFDARSWLALSITKIDREIAQTQYEKAVQAAFRDVSDALARKANINSELEAQQSLVVGSSETYRLSNMRYEKGIDIFLSVLDAQRSLYAAQQSLIAIRLAKMANQIRLYAVLGGGVENTEPE